MKGPTVLTGIATIGIVIAATLVGAFSTGFLYTSVYGGEGFFTAAAIGAGVCLFFTNCFVVMKENVIEDGVKAVMLAALGGLFWCNLPMIAFAFFVAACIAPASNLAVQQYWPR